MSTVLRASGLGKRYRRRWALTDCDLDIEAGHVTGLVGPNTLSITGSTINDNSVASDGDGGGVYADIMGGSAMLVNS